MSQAKRVQVRRTIYRNAEGFLVRECGQGPFGACIFTRLR